MKIEEWKNENAYYRDDGPTDHMGRLLEFTREDVDRLVKELMEDLVQGFTGCTNHGCLITGGPKGMGTNSVCTCWRDPRMQVVLHKIRAKRFGK